MVKAMGGTGGIEEEHKQPVAASSHSLPRGFALELGPGLSWAAQPAQSSPEHEPVVGGTHPAATRALLGTAAW